MKELSTAWTVRALVREEKTPAGGSPGLGWLITSEGQMGPIRLARQGGGRAARMDLRTFLLLLTVTVRQVPPCSRTRRREELISEEKPTRLDQLIWG